MACCIVALLSVALCSAWAALRRAVTVELKCFCTQALHFTWFRMSGLGRGESLLKFQADFAACSVTSFAETRSKASRTPAAVVGLSSAGKQASKLVKPLFECWRSNCLYRPNADSRISVLSGNRSPACSCCSASCTILVILVDVEPLKKQFEDAGCTTKSNPPSEVRCQLDHACSIAARKYDTFPAVDHQAG